MPAGHFRDRSDDDGYLILHNSVPLEIISNAQLATERITDELAEGRVESRNVPRAFEDGPFNIRFKKIYENEPEYTPVQFTMEFIPGTRILGVLKHLTTISTSIMI